MMRVLICDDEVNVCRLLISLINWDALDLELVGLAHTGPEALQKIQDLLPQIVITNVRIPVFDGLELVSRTQALGIHANFIVVSGYQHFEYVYNALRHGIVDYLLKPINREELNNALEVIISRHQKDLYENNRTRNLERSLQQAQKSLVTRYLNDIIGGRAQDLTTENLELYGLDWHRDRYGCFALRVDTAHYEDFVSATIESAVSKMESQIRQLSCDAISPPLLQIRDSSIFCLYNYDSLHPDAMQKYYDTVLSTANCVAAMFPEMHVTMGIGRSCASLSDLPRATEDAIQAVRSRIMLGVDRIIYAETLNSSSSAVEALVEGRWPELWQTLQTCDQSSFSELLSSLIFDEAVTTSPIGPHTLTIALLRQFCLANSEDSLNGFDAKQFAAELTGQLSHIWNRRQLCRMLDDAFADYIRCLKKCESEALDLPILRAKEYIAAHCESPCTLNEVAAYVHLSPAYFSSQFKKRVGISFNRYVTAAKLDVAKQLLKQSDDTVEAISLSVGYKDIKYFRKLFKQQVGITPSRYRSIYR